MNNIFIESICYGLTTLIINNIILYIIFNNYQKNLKNFHEIYLQLSKYYILEITFFFIGIILYISTEYFYLII